MDKPRILVIDDEESIRFTFTKFLVQENYSVSTAGDFSEALEQIDGDDFDLIFADILLGGKTGIDVLHQVKQRGISAPVVMVTGAPNADTAAEAVRLGAFDYISKPVDKQMLLRVAGLALQHKAILEENRQYRANLEAVFRSVKDGIITVDVNRRVLEVNEAAEKNCRLPRQQVIGKDMRTLPVFFHEKCVEILEKTLVERKPFESERVECRREGGGIQTVALTTAPLLDRESNFIGAVLVVRDETRLAALERDLKARRRFHRLVGQNEQMQSIYGLIETLSDVDSTVLIIGESGTGKELVAEALHDGGNRRNKPLVKVNCSALPESLLETELFGHVKGAFTDAVSDKIGRFERADGGTLFLDEIGDLSPAMQLRLLRVLQEKEFERVGDSTPISADVRVAAATHVNLKQKVKQGEFREDLYYRLKVFELALPPLRERLDDIPLLVDHFLEKLNSKFNRRIEGISTEVAQAFNAYGWPGNVREFEHTLEHAFVFCRDGIITTDHLPAELKGAEQARQGRSGDQRDDRRFAILEALNKTGWNKSKAARLLGIGRMTLYRKIEEYDLAEERVGE